MLAPRVARLGYLGGFFAVGARQPRALVAFIDFTEALKSAVPADLTEIVALRAATILDNSYERSQHVRLASTQGMSQAWIAAALDGEVGSPVLDGRQTATLRLTENLVRGSGHDSRADLDAVISACGPDMAVAIVFLVSRYVAHAIAANAFSLVDPLTEAVSLSDRTARSEHRD